jgi:hypothetical protein
MSSTAFPYFIRIDTRRRFSIIRFPNDINLVTALHEFAQTLPADEFYSLTRTSREISVIQDAKYPAYPQSLAEELFPLVQVEEGFVLLEVVPDGAEQIDFCIDGCRRKLIMCSGDGATGTIGYYIGAERDSYLRDQYL